MAHDCDIIEANVLCKTFSHGDKLCHVSNPLTVKIKGVRYIEGEGGLFLLSHPLSEDSALLFNGSVNRNNCVMCWVFLASSVWLCLWVSVAWNDPWVCALCSSVAPFWQTVLPRDTAPRVHHDPLHFLPDRLCSFTPYITSPLEPKKWHTQIWRHSVCACGYMIVKAAHTPIVVIQMCEIMLLVY